MSTEPKLEEAVIKHREEMEIPEAENKEATHVDPGSVGVTGSIDGDTNQTAEKVNSNGNSNVNGKNDKNSENSVGDQALSPAMPPPPPSTPTTPCPAGPGSNGTGTVRQDFYQTDADFVLSILAKNVDPSTVSVDFQPDTLKAKAKLANGQDYVLEAKLFGSVRPGNCSYQVTRAKIEIRLRKDNFGMWPALESVAVVEKKDGNGKLPLPWSSKKKKDLDWDKVEKEIVKESQKEEDVGSPFAALYEMCDDDTKRAMMKSMQESGGTCLNMNWKEVSKKKHEISPPDGMEWRKWD